MRSLPVREYDRTVNSEIERLLYQVDVIRMDSRGLLAEANEEQLNWSPAPGRWSAGQCFAHLNITHQKWLPLFEEAIEAGRAKGMLSEGPYTYGFLSRMFLRAMEPPPGMKVKAPKAFRPPERVEREALLAEFEEHHERAAEAMRSANGLDLARINIASAFSKHVKYSLGMGFWLLAAHDRRHIWQAREVWNAPGFPKKSS